MTTHHAVRAAKLPEAVSISSHGAAHFVVTATQTSESFRLFQARHSGASPCSSVPSTSAVSRRVFRLAHLTESDWALLLRACRRCTTPTRAFNFSSPGDVSSPPRWTESDGRVDNNAFMHIVERRPGDFVPNNMIYHTLQQFTNAAGDAQVEARNTAFHAFVSTLQTPALSDDETETAATADYEQSSVLPETVQRQDPLAEDSTARSRSAANQRARPACVTDVDIEGPASNVFYFYPHPVNVATSVPFRSTHFCVMVNLKPIVPRHLMVVPLRCVGTIHGLSEEEVADWGRTMALTIRALDVAARLDRHEPMQSSLSAPPSEGNYSVAVQQGTEAGQTVPHLHTHVIPFDPVGKLAGEPETDEAEQQRRPPRSQAAMAEETRFFADIFRHLVN